MSGLLSRIERVNGFGSAVGSDGYVFRPESEDELRHVLIIAQQSGRTVTLRGSGRSYGDASCGSEAIIVDCTNWNQIREFDAESGLVTCDPGVTFEQLWRFGITRGFWPPVVTGTMKPTLAGALGMNVHGKNNFRQGTLGEHVARLSVMWASGEVESLGPDHPKFRAVISSAGLLGAIVSVTLRLRRIVSPNLRVTAISAKNWEEQIELLGDPGERSDYAVSWIDLFGRGAKSGRGLVHVADYVTDPEPLPPSDSACDLPSRIMGIVPKSQVWRILRGLNNRAGMRLVNGAKYALSKRANGLQPHRQSLVEFSFLLDYVPGWQRAYEPGGMIQYQCLVPKAAAAPTFRELTELQQSQKMESFLGVLKRHRPENFLLSHGVDGFSLAMDFKVTQANRESLWAMCHRMNEIVLRAGGKFYFAKDATLRPADVRGYLGGALTEFQALKRELDPQMLFSSDLAVRTRLFEPDEA